MKVPKDMETVKHKVQRYFQYAFYAAILLIAIFAFPGAVEIDDQVFVINMGFDRLDNGMLRMTVQIPSGEQSGSSGSGSSDSGGGSPGGSGQAQEQQSAAESEMNKKRDESRQNGYIIASADGVNYGDTYNIMSATLPRIINASQVKQVIFSEKLAQEDTFADLVSQLMYSVEFFNSAQVVICDGEASELIKQQQLVMGARLSKAQDSSNYTHQAIGFVLNAPIADMYFNFNTNYGDPVAILAAVNMFDNEASSTQDRSGDVYAGETARAGANVNDFFGTALFDETHMVGKLTGYETQLLKMMRGSVSKLLVMDDSYIANANVRTGPEIEVIIGEAPEIRVHVHMNIVTNLIGVSAERMAARLQEDLTELVRKCQEYGSDPFMFGSYAASQFGTYDEFEKYDWPAKFKLAKIAVSATVEPTQA